MINAQKIDAAADEASETAVESAPRAKSRAGKPAKAASAFRTISEVADSLNVPQHVLRFWETKFSQIRPLKRGGGRRYYRPEDVALLVRVHELLYTEGYTIKGVQKLLKGQGKIQIVAQTRQDAPYIAQEPGVALSQTESGAADPVVAAPDSAAAQTLTVVQRSILQAMLGELQDLRSLIRGG